VLGVMVKGNALAPRFDTVKDLAALIDPTGTFPNEVDAGLRLNGAIPVPVIDPTAGLPKPL
jgi:hypothetical protein